MTAAQEGKRSVDWNGAELGGTVTQKGRNFSPGAKKEAQQKTIG